RGKKKDNRTPAAAKERRDCSAEPKEGAEIKDAKKVKKEAGPAEKREQSFPAEAAESDERRARAESGQHESADRRRTAARRFKLGGHGPQSGGRGGLCVALWAGCRGLENPASREIGAEHRRIREPRGRRGRH